MRALRQPEGHRPPQRGDTRPAAARRRRAGARAPRNAGAAEPRAREASHALFSLATHYAPAATGVCPSRRMTPSALPRPRLGMPTQAVGASRAHPAAKRGRRERRAANRHTVSNTGGVRSRGRNAAGRDGQEARQSGILTAPSIMHWSPVAESDPQRGPGAPGPPEQHPTCKVASTVAGIRAMCFFAAKRPCAARTQARIGATCTARRGGANAGGAVSPGPLWGHIRRQGAQARHKGWSRGDATQAVLPIDARLSTTPFPVAVP